MPRKPAKNSGKPDINSLSARQRRILDVIHDAVMLRGYPPSIREIGDAADCNPPPPWPTSSSNSRRRAFCVATLTSHEP